MKIYFAHPIGHYGDEYEAHCLANIRRLYPGAEILNPAEPQYAEAYKASGGKGMDYWCDLVRSCDMLIAAPFARDGEHGMGVWREMETMHAKGGLTLEICGDRLSFVNVASIRPLSIDQTRARNKALKEDRERKF